jgi:toxin ParE1/3/4
MAAVQWCPTLTPRANDDLFEIVAWTEEHFGSAQAEVYREVILAALRDLKDGPQLAGVRKRNEIRPGLLSLHVARRGRHGRHLVLFRIAPGGEPMIEVLRILHDQMDLVRHLPAQ